MADVLVVDSGELGELLAALLDQYGLAAARARSGEEALERALAERPKVAIIAYELPDAPGIDVADLLRAELGTKVILTYAQHIVTDADDTLLPRIGRMDAAFARPFRSLTLVEAAARLMGRELPRKDGGSTHLPLSSTEGPPVIDDGEELVLDVEVTPSPTRPLEGPGSALGLPAPGAAPLPRSLDDGSFDGVIVTGEMPPPAALGPAPALEERIAEQRAYSLPGGLADLWQRVKERRAGAPENRAPGSEGALSPRALADMLDAFHQSQTTGELWLQKGSAKRVLLLRRGTIVGARSNIEAEDLSSLAARKGALSADDVMLVREDVVDGQRKTIVDAIIARGLLAEDTLRNLIEDHVRRVALGSFTWQSGAMKVTLEGRATREQVPVRVPVGDVIVRGILLTEGDEALKAAAPDDARFSPASDSGYGLEDLSLSADEARVVVAMDGTKTIKDLVTLFDPDVPPRTIRGLAAGLLCLNLVNFVGWGPASARRISFF